MEIKKCLWCKKEFEDKRIKWKRGKGFNKKYCSQKCRTQSNASKRYSRLKDDFKFREKNITRAREWRLAHRERFNAKVLPYAKAWQKKNYWECKKKHLCYICREKVLDEHAACEKCRIKKRKHKV